MNNFLDSFSNKKFLIIFILIGLIIYLNSVQNNFVGDDSEQIINNTLVHSIDNLETFFTGSTFYNGQNNLTGIYYKPIQNLIFSLEYSLFGPNYIAFHMFQIILHIFNAFVLFLVLKYFFRKSVAFILAIIFMVHPINSESVFYISATQDIIFFSFGILSLWITLKFKTKRSLILASIFLLMSLLSKETGILFVCIINAYNFIFRKKNFYFQLGLSIIACAIYFILRLHAIGLFLPSLNSPLDSLSLISRVVMAPTILYSYLKLFIFPVFLSSSYQWIITKLSLYNFYFPLSVDIIFICIFAFFIKNLHKQSQQYLNIFLFFSLWFLIGVIFHLQIIPLDSTLAERWFYFPIVGVLGMIGVFLEIIEFNFNRKFYLISSIIIVLLLSTRTFVRSFDWRDNLTLDLHDILVTKDSYDLENGIGAELIKQNQFEEARSHIERSIRLYPYVTNYNNLGLIYMNLGEYDKAKQAYLNALKYGDYYLTYENLGGLILISGNSNDNLNFLNEAVKKFPQDSKLWLYLAILGYKNGDNSTAQIAISHAFQLDQSLGAIYNSIMNNQPLNIDFKTNP